MTDYSVAINWHAARETEKVETLCTFLESNGISVHRWRDDPITTSRIHARVIVVCWQYMQLNAFNRELAKAVESDTPLVYVWIKSEKETSKDIDTLAQDKLFDELIHDDNQTSLFRMVLAKIIDSASQFEPEELVDVKRQKLQKTCLIAFLALLVLGLAIIGLLIGYFFQSEIKEQCNNY